jgi:hypothetical protein
MAKALSEKLEAIDCTPIRHGGEMFPYPDPMREVSRFKLGEPLHAGRTETLPMKKASGQVP